MAEKRCPRCRLYSPPHAQRCDCGYDFEAGSVMSSYLTPEQMARSKADVVGVGELLLSLIFPIIGVIYGTVLLAKGRPRGRTIVIYSALAMAVLVCVGLFIPTWTL